MSAETKVDVLAIIKRLSEHALTCCEMEADMHMDACRAHAAVAELIEADREYDEACAEMARRRSDITPLLWNRFVRALDRRAAALARIGGAK